MSADDLASLAGLADGTGTAPRDHQRARRRWPLVMIPVVIVAGAVVAFAMRGGSGNTAEAKKKEPPPAPTLATGTPATARTGEPPKPNITVEPIEPAGGGSGSNEIQMTPAPARPPTQPPAQAQTTKPHRPSGGHKDIKPPAPPPPVDPKKDQVTKDQVTNRWLATRREWESYKTTHTGLEKEWNDLANYVVYNLHGEANLAETLRRIDAFSRKMRED